jgi:hypothetical protein
VTEFTRAVFLSYASQDAVAARRISDALRSAGIEVWFDQSELRGGDAWDQRIRQQIRDCALFVPVISATTTARPEGYFRFEWSLAEQRSHVIGRNKAFIVPVCLDQTAQPGADVPESFQRIQWTRLPGGHATAAFVERVGRLLAPEPVGSPASASAATAVSAPVKAAPLHRQSKSLLLLIVALITVVIAYYLVHEYFLRHASPPPAPPPAKAMGDNATHTSVAPATSATAHFAPPSHSIAVPVVDMSRDK